MVLLIIGIILVIISMIQATGTTYSGRFAPVTLVIGSVLILLGLL